MLCVGALRSGTKKEGPGNPGPVRGKSEDRSGNGSGLPERLVAFAARVLRIKADVAVPLPYPRDWTMKTTPDFATLKARLMGEIREEVRKAAIG